jgi:TolA-binding protein
MSVQNKVAPITVFQVWNWEKRAERLKKRQKKNTARINDLFAQIRELEDENEALGDREGDLLSKIEHSGVYD